jgi:peptidoglycan/xylan/chitin deacetylase (PgdA/CDA1 family)
MAIKVKYFIRKVFGGIFLYAGIFHFVRFLHNICGKRVTIITYHRITDRKMSEIEASLPFLFTSQQVFEKQLMFIKKRYNVITFEELMKWGKNGKPPWNCLIITFDDGYEDNFRSAHKSLGKMSLPATFFITVDKIGNKNGGPYWWDRLYYYLKEIQRQEDKGYSNEVKMEFFPIYEEFKNNASGLFSRMNKEETDKIEKLLNRMEEEFGINNEKLFRENTMLNWEQISEMSRNHDFGSHTCSHANLLKLSDAQKYHEIVESKTIIEKSMSRKVSVFSSPAGHMNEEIKGFVEKGGYEFAVSAAEPGINGMKTDRYHLKRINIWEGTSLSLKGKFSKGYFSFKMLGF